MSTSPWSRLLPPLPPRDPQEPHRASTNLELLFDLCFVVAVAQGAAHLHHALSAGEVGHAVMSYLSVFFAVWWAWMNFTWFASAYDSDDRSYRLAVLVQMGGVLVLAAGVGRSFEHGDLSVVTLGYCIMRLGLVWLWLRAAQGDPGRAGVAKRYALGVAICQLGWVGLVAVPLELRMPLSPMLIAAELSVPVWAERLAPTPWHPHHVAERYGLMTIIVLGESILAATNSVEAGLEAGEGWRLADLAAGGLATVFGMWWFYFERPAHAFLRNSRLAFVWGYGHFFIFAAAAAVGAGLGVAQDALTGAAPAAGAGLAFSVPVALYLVGTWFLHLRHHEGARRVAPLVTAALALVAGLLPHTTALVGGLMVGLVLSRR